MPMPPDRGLGLDDHEHGPPIAPQLGEPHPEDAIPLTEPWPLRSSLQDRQLLKQRQIPHDQRVSRQ